MKKLLFFLLFPLFVFAESGDDNNTVVREKHYLSEKMLDSFLDLLTSESFMTEFDFEKNKTRMNEQSIIELNSKIEKVIENFSIALTELSKNQQELAKKDGEIGKLKNENVANPNIASQNSMKIERLEQEITAIKSMLLELKNRERKSELKINTDTKKPTENITSVSSSKTMYVGVDEAPVKQTPSDDSKTLKILRKDSRVFIESCDRFKWCKLKNEEAYIAGYRLKN